MCNQALTCVSKTVSLSTSTILIKLVFLPVQKLPITQLTYTWTTKVIRVQISAYLACMLTIAQGIATLYVQVDSGLTTQPVDACQSARSILTFTDSRKYVTFHVPILAFTHKTPQENV
jgi:hypothetical protein